MDKELEYLLLKKNKYNKLNKYILKNIFDISLNIIDVNKNLDKLNFLYAFKNNDYNFSEYIFEENSKTLKKSYFESNNFLILLEDYYNKNFQDFLFIEEIIRKDNDDSKIDSLLYCFLIQIYHNICSLTERIIELMDILLIYNKKISKIYKYKIKENRNK